MKMNGIKRSVLDFVCAFVIVLTVVVCAALLTNAGFFENAFMYDESTTTMEIFGMELKLDERVVALSDKLLLFNDVIFGRGFAEAVKEAWKYVLDYVSDVLTVIFTLARRLMGAE